MKPNLYALLIGINQYKNTEIPDLRGCVNDVNKVSEFLQEHTKRNFDLILDRLTDLDATRNYVIDRFEAITKRIQKGDTFFLHYSGHGAYEEPTADLRSFFPEPQFETLVLHDSRSGGITDLADKELAVLLNNIYEKGAQVVCVVDSCHSGNISRDVDSFTLGASRQVAKPGYTRNLEDMLDGYYSKMLKKEGIIEAPLAKHIVMAACERTQQAREIPQTNQGVFTTALLEALEKSGGNISYVDLYQKTRIAIKRLSYEQNPQFEPYNYFNSYDTFLLGKGSQSRPVIHVAFSNNAWRMKMGAAQGIPTNDKKEIKVNIVTEATSLMEEAPVVARARVDKVLLNECILDIDADLPKNQNFEAQLSVFPVAPLLLHLPAEEGSLLALKEYLHSREDLPLAFTEDREQSTFSLDYTDLAYTITHVPSQTFIGGAKGDEPALQYIYRLLKKIQHWDIAKKLQNNKTLLDIGQVELILEEYVGNESIVHTADTAIDCYPDPNQSERWVAQVGLRVKNNTDRKLHFSLLYLSQSYGVTLFPEGNFELPAHESKLVWKGRAGFFKADEKDKLSTTDTYKLIVSTDRTDSFLLEQEGVELGKIVDFIASGTRSLEFEGSTEKSIPKEDWFTKTLEITLVKNLALVGEKTGKLAEGLIEIAPHPSLRAKVSLQSTLSSTRNISGMVFPELLTEEGIELLGFSRTRSLGDNLIELSDIQGADGVSSDNPLVLTLNTSLDTDDTLLPVTFNGEDILPIGDLADYSNGKAEIHITQLPEEQVHSRTLGRALKFAILKMVFSKKGGDIYKIRKVIFENETIFFEDVTINEVKAAQKILLLIHGIISNTKGFATTLPYALKKEQADSGYDLILAYDYENLNTPIKEISRQLKSQLAALGIDEKVKNGDRPKSIDILTHSMGGLVARWFIERENGNKIAGRLIMAGPPNAGSEFGTITEYREMAIAGLTFALNVPFLKPYLIWAKGVITALKSTEELTKALADMHPKKSDFLKELNLSEDPQIPYFILAGNTRIYKKLQPEEANYFSRLLEKTQISLGDAFHKQKENDIAVSATSMENIPDGRMPNAVVFELPCHHFNYFFQKDSADKIKELLFSNEQV